MPSHDRYRFGDVLLPVVEDTVASLPALLREQQRNELDREKIAIENKRIEAAQQQNDRAFEAQENARAQANERYKEEFEFKKEQAKQAEMNRLVASVEEPYQKAMIYRKYGFNDLAENFTAMGDKQEAQKDILKEFDSFTDPNDILKNSSTALSGLDPTSSAATYVREARQQAIDDLDVKYSELLEIPGFRIAHERYTQGMKDLTMSEDNKKLLGEAYVKALEKYGAVDMTTPEASGASDVNFAEDDAAKAVDEILSDTGLNLSTGETSTDRTLQEQAKETLNISNMKIGRVNEELKSRNKIIRNLSQQQNVRELSQEEKEELEEQTSIVNELKSRMEQERSRGRAARTFREAAFGRPFG
tara:strand:- start:584 stop:1663 length:1080 start_codon:yes stop_codon:yes gene_type:complete